MTVVLHVEGLTKRFGGLTATDGAQLAVRTGEIHALIGPNGAGKTTLVQQLTGALAPDAGRIVFDGADITHLPQHRRVLRGLARSYQITTVFKRLSVHANLALAMQACEKRPLAFWQPARRDVARYEEAAALAARMGLAARLKQTAGALSHGEQRQLEVGLAVAARPRLLLLDEPMAGIGAEESERMIELLASLRSETTILLVEHDMDAVFRLADTISTLVSGRVIASGPPAVIRDHAEVRRAYLGDESHAPAATNR